MPQSDGKNVLKRMAFEFRGVTHELVVNPQEYTQDEPSRSTVTQTKGGAWIDDFGAGLVNIYIKGRSGFKNGSSVEKFKDLRNMIRNYYNAHKPGEEVTQELLFHNFTDEESWVVHTDPSGFRLMRSKSNPLEFMYEIKLICLRQAQLPSFSQKNQKQSGVGNPFGSSIPKSNTVSVSKTTALYKSAVPNLNTTLGLNQSSLKVPTVYSNFSAPLKTLSNGSVVLTNGASAGDSKAKSMLLLESDNSPVDLKMQPQISNLAMDLYKEINLANSTNLTNNGIPADSLLYSLVYMDKTGLSADLVDMIRAITLESIAVTRAIQIDPDNVQKRLSQGDVLRLIDNIRWLSEELFNLANGENVEVVEKLRWLERSFSYLVSTPSLFEPKITDSVNSFNNAQGGSSV
ncbi:hypothetical protein D3C74_50830 [compost metagenome]